MGTRTVWNNLSQSVFEYRRSGYDEKQRRKADFFDGMKDAEVDDLNR
jgi:hypothetical protein